MSPAVGTSRRPRRRVQPDQRQAADDRCGERRRGERAHPVRPPVHPHLGDDGRDRGHHVTDQHAEPGTGQPGAVGVDPSRHQHERERDQPADEQARQPAQRAPPGPAVRAGHGSRDAHGSRSGAAARPSRQCRRTSHEPQRGAGRGGNSTSVAPPGQRVDGVGRVLGGVLGPREVLLERRLVVDGGDDLAGGHVVQLDARAGPAQRVPGTDGVERQRLVTAERRRDPAACPSCSRRPPARGPGRRSGRRDLRRRSAASAPTPSAPARRAWRRLPPATYSATHSRARRRYRAACSASRKPSPLQCRSTSAAAASGCGARPGGRRTTAAPGARRRPACSRRGRRTAGCGAVDVGQPVAPRAVGPGREPRGRDAQQRLGANAGSSASSPSCIPPSTPRQGARRAPRPVPVAERPHVADSRAAAHGSAAGDVADSCDSRCERADSRGAQPARTSTPAFARATSASNWAGSVVSAPIGVVLFVPW